ncbi:MAG: thiamine phosphate synthase [Sulfurovum sp.]|nr:MAG: thiamine phosphate synthase [Sulfurovum sp.]
MISYAITPSFILEEAFLDEYLSNLAIKADMVLYRDKSNLNYEKDALRFLQKAKEKNIKKVLIHQDIALAKNLNAYGVHLNSTQFHLIKESKKQNLFTIISTHSLDEALIAQELGADMVSFSPIFPTPHKGKPKGVDELNKVCNNANIGVIALGGIINLEHIEKIKASKAIGFASIRLFLK